MEACDRCHGMGAEPPTQSVVCHTCNGTGEVKRRQQSPLFGAVILTTALQFATIYVPFLNPVFRTQPLTLPELLITFAVSTIVFWGVEIEKTVRRRRDARRATVVAEVPEF